MLLEVVGDLVSEHGALRVGGTEVNAPQDSGVDDLLQHVREAFKTPCGPRFFANRGEIDFLRLAEVLQRAQECSGSAGMPGWVIGEWRRDERRRGGNRCGGV